MHLSNLRELEEKDYRNESYQHETLLKNIKRSKSPTRSSHANHSEFKQDVDMRANQGSFNTDFNEAIPVVEYVYFLI